MEDEFNKSQTVIQLFLTNCLDEDLQLSEMNQTREDSQVSQDIFTSPTKKMRKKITFDK